ncbi:hypothetical protein [Streptacidiphilus carbonis]|uniref:hypothetical protein n=1 Tax=Streptacidiphilus carbonis TaxID=105422 RepID=UPI000A6C4A60|nr:hypothetical protein [Streptacidiphilus carbonis]
MRAPNRTKATRRSAVVAAATCGLLALAPALAAHAAGSGWTVTGSTQHSTLTAGEGVATVHSGSSDTVLYRGAGSIPLSVLVQGWSHIGDPDSANGYVFDAYQSGASTPTSKMFRVTTPSGAAYEYTHALVSGELYNNSFDAVSPDTQWMVAGEWGTMDHLQIYPTPVLNPATSPTGGTLALSGEIQLDHAVNDIQACDFTSATQLVCVSDDSSRSLFADDKPLLQVDLAHALNGATVTGHVTDLGPIPQKSICSGGFEAEGDDYDPATGILRVEMIQPSICGAATTVYTYTRG